MGEEEPLPEGWEVREDQNGRIWYFDHNTRRVYEERPTVLTAGQLRRQHNDEERREMDSFARRHRTSFSEASSTPPPQQQQQQLAPAGAGSSSSAARVYPTIDPISDEPLPEGWEMRATPEGKIFFVDHNTRRTTWKDPRQMARQPQQQPQQVLTTSAAGAHTLTSPALGQLPAGWEERRTHDGRIFYVNHIERTTQWEDPRHQQSYSNTTQAQTYARDYRTKLAYFRSKLRQREGKVDITVSRENVFEDSFREVMRYSPDQLRKRLWIKFEGEDGLDYGGLAREWFYLFSHSAFSPYYGLFEYAARYG